MKVIAKALLIGNFLFAPLFAQMPVEMQRETYPKYAGIVDTSPPAQLWREIIIARESGNETLEDSLVQQFKQLFPGRLSLVPPIASGVAYARTK